MELLTYGKKILPTCLSEVNRRFAQSNSDPFPKPIAQNGASIDRIFLLNKADGTIREIVR